MAIIMITVCAIGLLGFGIGCFRLRRMQRLRSPKTQDPLAIANDPTSQSIVADSKEGQSSVFIDQENNDHRGPPPQYTQQIHPSPSHVVVIIPSGGSTLDSTLSPSSPPPPFNPPA